VEEMRHIDLERAIMRRICACFALEPDTVTVDHGALLFDSAGFEVAGHVLDSLSLAEVIVTLEHDLCVSILGTADLTDIESVAALARFLTHAAQPDALSVFEQEWSSNGESR
jgi:acyl carrier protein